MTFEITFLHGDGDPSAHTTDLAEINVLVEWAGRTGVPVRIRALTVQDTDVLRQETGHG
ncbi:hypothetical protein ACFY12_09160 [Streptomyces sp. NPDC001339]|uniref:hypothetical protein n=1 Tax=Streptomyces sp. NPDC001339 TaxID=3364563 RepID=UPI0036913C95